jgi:hypothetical protein
MVLEIMTVVTFGSPDDSLSDSVCLLVVSESELGGTLSSDVIVALVN